MSSAPSFHLFVCSLAACCRAHLRSDPVVVARSRSSPARRSTSTRSCERLATAETPYLFGIFPRVLEYETYDPTVLARDLERIERAYRARGYYEAKVTAARVVHVDEHHVRVEIRVHEGEPVKVRRRRYARPGLVPLESFDRHATRRTRAIRAQARRHLRRGALRSGQARCRRALRAQGFAFAKVEGPSQRSTSPSTPST